MTYLNAAHLKALDVKGALKEGSFKAAEPETIATASQPKPGLAGQNHGVDHMDDTIVADDIGLDGFGIIDHHRFSTGGKPKTLSSYGLGRIQPETSPAITLPGTT